MSEQKRFGPRRLGVATMALAMALAILTQAPAGLAAQDGPRHGGRHDGMGMMTGGMALKGLDLDEGQREALDELMLGYREELSVRFQAAAAARQALDDQIHAALFDEAAIRAAAAELAAAEAETAVTRAEIHQQVRGLLSAEQIAQLEEQREERRERFSQHRRQRFERRSSRSDSQ